METKELKDYKVANLYTYQQYISKLIYLVYKTRLAIVL